MGGLFVMDEARGRLYPPEMFGYSCRELATGTGVIDRGPILGVMIALLNSEDSRFLLPSKNLFALSLSSGSEILPNLGVGGTLLDWGMVRTR